MHALQHAGQSWMLRVCVCVCACACVCVCAKTCICTCMFCECMHDCWQGYNVREIRVSVSFSLIPTSCEEVSVHAECVYIWV